MTEIVIVPPPESAKPTMLSIAEGVAKAHGLNLAEMKGPSRVHHISHPRQEAMYLMRQVLWPDGTPRYSTTHIGQFFNRDHTTAIFGIRAYKKRSNLP